MQDDYREMTVARKKDIVHIGCFVHARRKFIEVTKAIQYALNNWKKLIAYIEDGRLMPDNNAAENAIRPFVVGRKS
jgi:Transposase IS66 family